MSESDNTFLWDMDGSLADYEAALIRDLNLLRSPQEVQVERGNLWDLEKFDHIRERMHLIKNQPGWWLNLAPILKGFAVFSIAKEIGFRNQILTKGPHNRSRAWAEKVEWCAKHLSEADICIVSKNGGESVPQKSGVYGKVLYDDYPDYVQGWLEHRPRGLAIMPVRKGVELKHSVYAHPNVIKWDGQDETFSYIKRMLLRVFARKPNEPLDLKEDVPHDQEARQDRNPDHHPQVDQRDGAGSVQEG